MVQLVSLRTGNEERRANVAKLDVDDLLGLEHAPLDHVRRVRVIHVVIRPLMRFRCTLLDLLPPMPVPHHQLPPLHEQVGDSLRDDLVLNEPLRNLGEVARRHPNAAGELLVPHPG